MERNTVINVLLIIAAIVLAIALFGAGALWRGNATPRRTSYLMFDYVGFANKTAPARLS